ISDPFGSSPDDRLYKTGDLGRWRPDGAVEYLGRNDHQVKLRGLRIELGEIETQLTRHELVKEAVVIAREDDPGDKRLVGYLTLDVPRLKSSRDELVDQWKTVYEETYAQEASGPSFIGWNSSYDGMPIPEAEMHEWLHGTLERIRSLRPRRVLEIGCGVGLLLQHLAPECALYRATDFSAKHLEQLRSWIRGRSDLQHVQLERASALELEPPPEETYDTIILNSVVQYFPDLNYLEQVLERAARYLVPGGAFFIGDVRHFGLHRVFLSSVHLAKAESALTASKLKSRVDRAIELEKELLIEPGFFAELPGNLPDIRSASVLLKRAKADNELTRYRYDVILRTSEPAIADAEEPRWTSDEDCLTQLSSYLRDKRPRAICVRGIGNRRLFRDVHAAKLLTASNGETSAGSLRKQLQELEPVGADPERLWQIAEQHDYQARLSWTPGYEDGRFDVELIDARSAHAATQTALYRAAPESRTSAPTRQYANDPLEKGLRRRLIPKLREYVAEQLPSYMVPSALVVLDHLPLSPNGKLDRRALPPPDPELQSSTDREPPQGALEELLAGIWQELLRVQEVGRHDNFFELGGHSLLIVQMLERLRRRGFAVALQSIFQHPTVAALALELSALTAAPQAQAQVPPNLIPPHCQAIQPALLPLIELTAEELERIVQAVPGAAENIQDIYPLAPLQEGILFHHLLNPQ